MKYLLDTHTAIWFFEGNDALSKNTRKLIIQAPENVTVSYASVWETAIKQGKGKLLLKHTLDVYVRQAEFALLGIELAHIHATTTLQPVHRDPFDRLLIAQALEENMTLITGDSKILQYPNIKLLDARK